MAQSTDGPYSDSFGPVTTDFSHTLVLPKFNTALGTLVEVDLTFNTSFDQSGTVTNNNAGAATFTTKTHGDFTLADGANTLVASYDEQQQYIALASGATANYGPFSGTPSASTILTSGSFFNDFLGPGNINLGFSTASSETFVGGGGNESGTINTTAAGTAIVTYKYNASVTTPEPGSYALIAGIFSSGAFLALRRRERRKEREEALALRSRV